MERHEYGCSKILRKLGICRETRFQRQEEVILQKALINVVSQINPVHTLPQPFINISLKIILPSMPRFFK